jgi:hypothetical protein
VALLSSVEDSSRSSVRDLMELVNGYYCRDCAEVELAKKGVDPAKAKREANGAGAAGSVRGGDGSKPEPGVNRVSTFGDVGRRLNLYA